MREQNRGSQPLDVLTGGGQDALFAHVLDSEYAGIARTMMDFGIREGMLNCFVICDEVCDIIPLSHDGNHCAGADDAVLRP